MVRAQAEGAQGKAQAGGLRPASEQGQWLPCGASQAFRSPGLRTASVLTQRWLVFCLDPVVGIFIHFKSFSSRDFWGSF